MVVRISPEDISKIMRFYDEIIPEQSRFQTGVRFNPPPNNSLTFLSEIAEVFDTYSNKPDSFDKYIEIETHYRMVREADGRDPSTLNLTPQQYKEKRAATLRAFVKHCVQLMTTSDRTGRRLWRISQTEPWEGAIASLTYI